MSVKLLSRQSKRQEKAEPNSVHWKDVSWNEIPDQEEIVLFSFIDKLTQKLLYTGGGVL